jgi:hypothetical protein
LNEFRALSAATVFPFVLRKTLARSSKCLPTSIEFGFQHLYRTPTVAVLDNLVVFPQDSANLV